MELIPGARLGLIRSSPASASGAWAKSGRRATRAWTAPSLSGPRERFSDRFDRETRAVAALNHPNVSALDVGPDYLVIEYVEGTPVAPVDTPHKLMDIAVQMSATDSPPLTPRGLFTAT